MFAWEFSHLTLIPLNKKYENIFTQAKESIKWENFNQLNIHEDYMVFVIIVFLFCIADVS